MPLPSTTLLPALAPHPLIRWIFPRLRRPTLAPTDSASPPTRMNMRFLRSGMAGVILVSLGFGVTKDDIRKNYFQADNKPTFAFSATIRTRAFIGNKVVSDS